MDDIIRLIDSKEEEKSRNLIFKYIQKWPWFIVSIVIGVLIGFFIYKNSPVTYEVTSKILVKNDGGDLSSMLEFNDPRRKIDKQTNIANQIGIFRSYTLYQKALKNLGWDYSWYQKKFMYNADLYKNAPFELKVSPMALNAKKVEILIKKISDKSYNIKIEADTRVHGYTQKIDIDQNVNFGDVFKNEFFNFTLDKGWGEIDLTYILQFNDINSLTSQYLGKTVAYSEEENSDIITVVVAGQDREREADFINELNEVITEFGMANKFENSQKSLEFIDSQLEKLKNTVGTAEENFSSYRRNNEVIDMSQEAQSVYKRLEEIDQEKYMTQLQINYYNELLAYLNNANGIEEVINPSVVGITDANLNNMLNKLMEMYSRREVLLFSVQENNPTVVMLDKEIKITRDALYETCNNQLKTTESKLESIQNRYNSIQSRLRRLPETEKNLIGMQREFDLNNELYTYMLQKKAEASISKASIAPEVQVIDPAIAEAAKRTGPNLVINVAAGLVGGGVIPFFLITLMIIFNNKIESQIEVEKQTRLPVFEGIMRHRFKANLPVINHPRSGLSESFRGLKTNITTIMKGKDSKVISINSLIPGEGKSFISCNLAAILAKSNKKILLIGADLHKPTLHNHLGIKNSIGLSDYLMNKKELREIIFSTSIDNLNFIQTGTVSGNPSELLDNSKFEQLIDQTKKMFDYIIIDNAPLLLVPDAILTSQNSDLSLFVLRMNYSHKNQIKQINKLVEFNNIENAAILMNDTKEHNYGYGYYYRKKYWKEGYGEIIPQKT